MQLFLDLQLSGFPGLKNGHLSFLTSIAGLLNVFSSLLKSVLLFPKEPNTFVLNAGMADFSALDEIVFFDVKSSLPASLESNKGIDLGADIARFSAGASAGVGGISFADEYIEARAFFSLCS